MPGVGTEICGPKRCMCSQLCDRDQGPLGPCSSPADSVPRCVHVRERAPSPERSARVPAGFHSVFLAHSYRRRAQQLSEIHRDQPEHPVERTVYWIEYILRHRGAHHLRATVYQLSFWQYFLLDVAAVLLLASALLCVLLSWATSLVRRQARRCWSRHRPSVVNGYPHNGVLNGRCQRNGQVALDKKAK